MATRSGSAASVDALQSLFLAVPSGSLLARNGVSADLSASVFGNLLPLCAPVVDASGAVVHALADQQRSTLKLVSFSLDSPERLASFSLTNSSHSTEIVALGNLDSDSNIPMAALRLSSSSQQITFLWLQNDAASPSGTWINAAVLDSTLASMRVSFRFPFLSNFQEFRPLASDDGLFVFSLASTELGVPCVLRITLNSSPAAECQPLSLFGSAATTNLLSLSLMDPTATQLLLGIDGTGYISTFETLPLLQPALPTNSSTTTKSVRLRSVPFPPPQRVPAAPNGTVFPSYILSVDTASTVRLYGVPSRAASQPQWTPLWTSDAHAYPVLAQGGALPLALDTARQWLFVCVAANDQVGAEGRLFAYAAATGDVVYGGDDTGSISCFRDSLVAVSRGMVVAASVSTGDVSLYTMVGNIAGGPPIEKVWTVAAGNVRAPYAFTPVLWVAADASKGILVVGSLVVSFGAEWNKMPAPVPAVGLGPVQVFDNVKRPTVSHPFVIQSATVSATGASTTLGNSLYPNSSAGGLPPLAIALIVVGTLCGLLITVTGLLVCRRRRTRKGRPVQMVSPSVDAGTGTDDLYGSNLLQTSNPPASNPLAMVAQSTVTSFPELGDEFASHLRRKADAELPFHSTRPSSEMLTELPFSDVTTHYEPNPPVQSASQNRPNSMSFVSKDFLEPSQTPSKKSSPAVTPKRNSILNLFFSSPGEKRERRESEMSVDTVLAGRVRRASSVLSSSTTIRGPGMTTLGVFRSELGVIADVESETEMTAVAKEGGTSRSLNNHDMAAVDVEEGVHGRSFSGGYSSTPWTLHTRSESGASLDQAGAPSPSSAAALNEQVRQLQISQEAGVPVPKAMGVSIATQTMDEPGIERATSPAISEASYARADSSLQFHNFVARPSSSTLDHPSAQSQNGYDASLSSNSFHPYQDRNSVLSNASSDAPLPAVVPISPHRRGGFGRFWNSVSPPSRQSTRVSSRASSRLKVDNPGPVRLNASPGRVTPVYDGLRSISGRPALSSTELAVLQHEFSGTDEDSGSFMTAPEGFSLHSGYSSSGSRHSESEGEGGYVTAASSMSVASGRSAGEGYVTAPEDMPGEAL